MRETTFSRPEPSATSWPRNPPGCIAVDGPPYLGHGDVAAAPLGHAELPRARLIGIGHVGVVAGRVVDAILRLRRRGLVGRGEHAALLRRVRHLHRLRL